MKRHYFLVLVLISVSTVTGCMQESDTHASEPVLEPTTFEVDPFCPNGLPNNWILGQVAGIAVDANDHTWIAHRPLSLTHEEAGAAQEPPLSQ